MTHAEFANAEAALPNVENEPLDAVEARRYRGAAAIKSRSSRPQRGKLRPGTGDVEAHLSRCPAAEACAALSTGPLADCDSIPVTEGEIRALCHDG